MDMFDEVDESEAVGGNNAPSLLALPSCSRDRKAPMAPSSSTSSVSK